MSPDYKRDACHITLTIYNPSEETRLLYFHKYSEATERFHRRMHWGKYFNVTPKALEAMYPKLHDFMRIRAQMDPKGIFINELLSKTFGL